MSKELSKAYEPGNYEDDIYKKWEESGFFNPDNLTGEPFSIMMPPPNVTGVLHLGHALENSLMDVMTRYQRCRGRKVLLLPGTDHAAVATQAKVEKVLAEKGILHPRQELGREKLLEEIRTYAENSKATILQQIRKMGTSCDWSRLAYTFDETRSKAVNEVFTRMYNDGLIYRGYRVINWSVKGQSTCSDDELEHVERKAKFYTFRYSKDFPIMISTTRPETKLGDTAVAVNPNDERYQKYIGKTFTVDVGALKPLKIKIIADETVDQSFGTGALGVTPAHSMVDFDMYLKQKAKQDPIGLIQVIGTDGKMTKEAGSAYAGLDVIAARDKFVSWLDEQGLLEKVEEIDQNVGTSDRFKDVVEALPMTQWFVDVNKVIPGKNKSLKDLMREAVTVGHNGDPKQKIVINPERFEKIYLSWIDNLRDWCISRQVWWGHRIPVWYNSKLKAQSSKPDNEELVDEEIYVGLTSPEGEGWVQDEDTLDTWFSSGLWTFSTLGWLTDSEDLKVFHPSSWMQMGSELLFFWMARMILMTTYTLDQIPFKDVYIHGILRDEKGKKFSKSSGNNIDPLDVIKQYGTDALRLSLISGNTPGNDSRFYEEKVEGARNLVNKLWNIARYIMQSPDNESGQSAYSQADVWVSEKMLTLIEGVTKDMDEFKFSQASEKLREFTWNDLADWYLEASKFQANFTKSLLKTILTDLLKLWHPFIPFVTEVIWDEMNQDLLLVSKWPNENKKVYEDIVKVNSANQFETVKEIVTAIRNARSENKIEPARKIKAVIYAGTKKDLVESQSELIKSLRTGLESLEISKSGEKIEKAIYATVGELEIYLLNAIDEAKERIRLAKEIDNLNNLITNLETKLSNQEFLDKAPKQLVAKEQDKLAGYKSELKKQKGQMENLNK